MPALNFPTLPTVNDVYTENGYSWIWNGQYWSSLTQTIQGAQGTQGISSGGGGGGGAQGIQGTTGVQGLTGIQGTSGSIIGESLTASGYTELENGLHVMWGTATIGSNDQTTYTFPVGVSLTTFSRVVVSGGEGGTPGGQDQNNPYVQTCTTTGFTVFNPRNLSITFFWIGIGY